MEAIRKLHETDATHVKSVPITEIHRGCVIWDGIVEVFSVRHPNASRCYAWSHPEEDEERYFAILGVYPVTNARKAVQMAIYQFGPN